MRKSRDYHARLVIYGLGEMKSVTYRRLVDWLEKRVKKMKKAKGGDYSKVFVAKLMK